MSEKPKRKLKDSDRKRRIATYLAAFIAAVISIAVIMLRINAIPSIELSDTQSLEINDHWTGLSPLAPMVQNYQLAMSSDGLIGKASFAVGNDDFRTGSADIAIPTDVAQEFITLLESAKLLDKPYVAYQAWTDDYPSITLTFNTAQGEVVIYSYSQGESHVPWAAKIRGDVYVIDSDIPMQALMLLEPYLHKDVFDDMIQEIQSE